MSIEIAKFCNACGITDEQLRKLTKYQLSTFIDELAVLFGCVSISELERHCSHLLMTNRIEKIKAKIQNIYTKATHVQVVPMPEIFGQFFGSFDIDI